MSEFTTVVPTETTNFTEADTTNVPVLDLTEESEYLPSVLFKKNIQSF